MTIKRIRHVSGFGYFIFLMWPLIGFLYAVRNFNILSLRRLILLYYGLFGFTFIIASQEIDSARHASDFHAMRNVSANQFFLNYRSLYSNEDIKPDIFLSSINFILSRFTDYEGVLFLTLSILLGWMLLKVMSINIKSYSIRPNFLSLIFLCLFFVLMPPFRIVSFRHYFASLIFIYGLYNFFEKKDYKYLVLAGFSLLIHFAFLMLMGLLFIYLVLGNRNWAFYVLLILSFFLHKEAADFVRNYGIILGGGFKSVVTGYTYEGYLESIKRASLSQNYILENYISWTTLFLLSISIGLKIKIKNWDYLSESLYSFCLLLMAFVNFTQDLEYISDRFSVLLQLILCMLLIRIFVFNKLINYRIYITGGIIVLILNFIILFRNTIEYANISLIFPLLPFSLIRLNFSLLDLFKFFY